MQHAPFLPSLCSSLPHRIRPPATFALPSRLPFPKVRLSTWLDRYDRDAVYGTHFFKQQCHVGDFAFHYSPGMGAKYCDERVCVAVCPLACLNKSSAVAEMGDRGHNRHEPKRGGLLCPFRGTGTPSSTMWPGPSSTFVPIKRRRLHPSSHMARMDMGQNWVEVGLPLFLGVSGSTSNTMSRRPRPTSVPSNILIHAAVWPQ